MPEKPLLTCQGFPGIQRWLQNRFSAPALPFSFSIGGIAVRIARVLCGITAPFWLLLGEPLWGQRVQFATPDALPASPAPAPATVGPGPTATFDGTIQAPPPQWDPYATPGGVPAPLLPQDPYLQFGSPGTLAPPGTTFERMQKFLQSVQLDYVWMPGNAQREFGIHDADLSATFAIPFLYNTETPLLVTPGFAFNAWHGPSTSAFWPLPARMYDAYLDAAWNPQVMPQAAAGAVPWLSGELSVRIGVYSDFKRLTSESIRYTGKGLAVLALSPSLKLKAGMWYLDRTRIKLLPAGGLVWTPNSDVCFEILFPNPKVSRRLSDFGNTQWWCYARGEYGGGAWTVDFPVPLEVHKLDYNDMRFGVGLEFDNEDFLSGLFEVGVAFERELYTDTSVELDLNTTVYLRGGLVY